MIIEVNQVELATELAHRKLVKFQNDAENGFIEDLPLPNGIYKDDGEGTVYTPEAQSKFDTYYDQFYDVIEKSIIKN